jgi:hypothetical protein
VCTYDKDASVSKLRGASIFGGMQLDDARIKFPSERRHPGSLVARHRHHDVLGLKPSVTGCHEEPVTLP